MMTTLHKLLLRFLLILLIGIHGRAVFPQIQVSQSTIDSLQAKLSSTQGNDTSIVSIYKSLSKIYLYKNARQAVRYAQEAADLSKKFEIRMDPMIYVYMARAYGRIPDNEKSLATFKAALAEATEQKDTAAMARVHNATGYHFFNQHNVPSALIEFDKAIEYGRLLNDTLILSDAWFGKVLTYNIFEEFQGMYSSIQQYLIYANPVSEQKRIADVYRLLGVYYRGVNDFQNAIDANQKSFEVASAINDSLLMGAALNHMAWYNYEMGNLEQSLKLYNRNISFYRLGSSNALANVYGNIGNIYRDWERYPEAIENYNKSIELSEQTHDIYNLSWLYNDISKLYERTGDYRQAYENQLLASLYGDSLASMNYQQTLAGARAQYEADKTAKELELLSVKLQRNRLLIWVLIGGSGFIALTALLIISRYRFKSRQRLEAMNHKISELNQTNLRQQMNPHFIFNTLNSIQYYVFQNDKISSNNYMTKFASLIRKTLENSRHTEISIKEELDALHLYLELEELRFKEKFEWTIRVDEEIDTLAYKIPTMLIQPYVENAITHGLINKENGKGFLNVELQLQNDQIHCIIEDNGIGRAKAMEIKQQKNGQHHSMGTNITESRLKLVNELYGKSMSVLYTDLMDSNGESAGTKVEINIPIIT
jgi:tetratricopeptide (TPR) repeat protein